jgi:catechol 2,3-dioxygenase-like lactoylglutathione lyase family enzyme
MDVSDILTPREAIPAGRAALSSWIDYAPGRRAPTASRLTKHPIRWGVPSFRYLVTNVEEAVDFYTSRLGVALEQRWGPAFAIVVRDCLELWLSGPDSTAARPMPDGTRPEPGGWNRIAIQVDDIDAESARLREAGVRFRGEVVVGPGGSQVVFDDPAGNPVELFQPAQPATDPDSDPIARSASSSHKEVIGDEDGCTCGSDRPSDTMTSD